MGTCHSGPDNFGLNIPVIRRMGGVFGRFYWRDAVAMYSQMDLVTAPIAPMADVLAQRGVRAPLQVVANGVDTHLFTPETSTRDEAMRTRHQLPRGKALLFVGRLDTDKGIGALIDLLRLLAQSPEGHLIVCGSGTQEAALRRTIGALGLGARVTLTGALPPAELSSMYRLASALVVVNRNEVQPLAVLEAFASGLPVIGLRSPNLEHTVIDGVNGFLVESISAVSVLGNRLCDDPVLRRELSARARRTAECQFALPIVAQAFLACYGSVQSGQ
jgi:glycosyltransferase involved in cell wall biosynthesis